MSEVICKGCGRERGDQQPGQWWHLNSYYGFRGSFCPSCYDMISHDSQGQPCRPADYLWMVLKLGVDKPKA
jgi:hypothetical protein